MKEIRREKGREEEEERGKVWRLFVYGCIDKYGN